MYFKGYEKLKHDNPLYFSKWLSEVKNVDLNLVRIPNLEVFNHVVTKRQLLELGTQLEAISSTEIENMGLSLSLDQKIKSFSSQRSSGIFEVDSLHWLMNKIFLDPNEFEITYEDICVIHATIFREKPEMFPGKIKENPPEIIISSRGYTDINSGEQSIRTCPSSKKREALRQLIDWWKMTSTKADSLVNYTLRDFIFLADFMVISPFAFGNGLVMRVLANILFLKRKYISVEEKESVKACAFSSIFRFNLNLFYSTLIFLGDWEEQKTDIATLIPFLQFMIALEQITIKRGKSLIQSKMAFMTLKELATKIDKNK